MGIFKNIPASDKRRVAGGIEFAIHALTVTLFVLLGYWLIVKAEMNVLLALIIVVVTSYFIGATIFWITRSVFKAIDKKLAKQIVEEMNVSIEDIPKKEKKKIKIPTIIKKKEPKTVEKIGNKVESGGTPEVPPLPIETPTPETKLPIEE
jgi:hypothetical protein